MKKYLSFLSFIALFFIGLQFSSAQTDARQSQSPEAIAKEKTHELHQLVNLTGGQQSAIFKVLVDAEQNMGELNKRDVTDNLKQEGSITVRKNTEEAFKRILTPEQFNIYMESLKKE
ncbi:hypothetical protein OS188_12220 [Xanthomarina sp. F1114]|uniref:hypothetical protein n=1 Tax=Xanthomarina sp. F1114 TaxID=2996019 RepID=UPI00225E4226|nr:hypothetical protein [Xanthomarina sp. F1114]MCX7548719.1 hypothetical protein [Xanthomarina sp. F1114]